MHTRSLSALLAAAALTSGALAQGRSAESIWRSNCISCHSQTGRGGGAGTTTLLTDELYNPAVGIETDRRFFETIKKGLPDKGMPTFGETLSDAEIWALVVHVRELQRDDWRKRHGSTKPDDSGVVKTQHHDYRIERVIEKDLEVPWSVDFLPDGRMLVTNRTGAVMIHSTGKPGGTLGKAIAGTPKVRSRGQGGMMDAAVHPDYAANKWVYLSFSDPDDSKGMTKLVRGHIKEDSDTATWTDEETLFEAKHDHYYNSDIHFGCRIVFDPPAYAAAQPPAGSPRFMYFAIGERGLMQWAPDLTRPNGKIYRLNDDGKVPADNPFVSEPADAYPQIWSYGHRNPQGLVFDLDGKLWDTEHGPRGGDELNLIERGKNYGWPTVSFGINYSDAPFRTPWPETGSDLVMPVYRWLPSIGACGLDVCRPGAAGEAFPKWKGDLLAGGLSGANVDRIRIKDGKVAEREEILHGMGRVRDVVTGPDGSVYVVLNDPDHVIRLINADAK